ncbi:MAG: DEAD/DEAH box helicase [Poseidonibacter sp.]|uniref:DEAD/DEAH box helicase n=1 Tax=Poseidonibacter sp. TaxID=2321188 RepID=UPI00359D4FD8
MSFSNLGLCEPILRAIQEQGYTTPTPIQKQAIPIVLSKKDVLAGAQTGTGKTAGFTLPLLQRLTEKKVVSKKHQVRALILTPTRELAAQVAQSVETYGKYLPYKSAVIFGGVGINPQKAAIRKGVDILIATPGRLLDLISQDCLDLSRVEFFVLDEADRMLDMGFIHDIKKVLKLLPSHRQNLLFSATFSSEIKKLADGLLDNPTLIEVARRNTSSEIVKQVIHHVNKNEKRDLLIKLINDGNWKQVLVFTRTKHGANKLSEQLDKFGISSAAIHGNKSQGARTKALANFKSGDVRVLVATDIAARGIDIDQLPHVVNFELPNVPEDYVHRIGRTGRAGNEGVAVSLVCVDEEELLKSIEKLIKKDIEKIDVEGFRVDPTIKAEPIQKKRGSNPRGNSNSNSRNRSNEKKSTESKPRTKEPRQRRTRDNSSTTARPSSRNTPRHRS